MDRILTNLIADFLKENQIDSVDLGEDFEKFNDYTIVSTEYSREFDWESVWTGRGGDTAIDGLAILVNGKLIDADDGKQDIDFLLEQNGKLDVVFIFIQSTADTSFDGSKMSWFSSGVKEFFNPRSKYRRSKEISDYADLAEYLINLSHRFEKNPLCKLFYICSGTWTDDTDLVETKKNCRNQLLSSNLFSDVIFEPVGSRDIQNLYHKTKNSITATFTFKNRITLPELPGIKEAYSGILPFSEFEKIMMDGNTVRDIYYDNIRAFYGLSNPINSTIADTIKGPAPELFTVLNNGITVVADDLLHTGDRMTITGFSIVNGCQTSNVLSYFISDPRLQELGIPIKLIVTKNDDVKNKITIATNSQNAVKREQLQAVTEFQKSLEDYYKTYQGDQRLYYERRPKQYQTDSSISKPRIISIPLQIKVFGAMFLNKPDRVTSYFGYVIKEFVEGDNKEKRIMIFHPEHKPIMYYTAALTYYQLDQLFRAKKIDAKYRKYKFFILALLGKLSRAEVLLKKMNSEKNCQRVCEPILITLMDPTKTLSYVQKAIKIIDASGISLENKDTLKNANTTSILNKKFAEIYNDPSS